MPDVGPVGAPAAGCRRRIVVVVRRIVVVGRRIVVVVAAPPATVELVVELVVELDEDVVGIVVVVVVDVVLVELVVVELVVVVELLVLDVGGGTIEFAADTVPWTSALHAKLSVDRYTTVPPTRVFSRSSNVNG